MAQVSPQYCPRCGTAIVPQQKFCATCGLPRALQNVEPSSVAPPSQPQSSPADQVSMGGFAAPSSQQQQPSPASQAPMGGFVAPQQQQPLPASQASMGGYPPPQQQQPSPAGQVSMGGFATPPAQQQPASAGQVPMGGYSPSQQPLAQHAAVFSPSASSGKRKIGRTGIISLLVALLLVLIALGYFALQAFGVGKPAQAPITRTDINATVTYASTDLTILNAQQSRNFLDDSHTASDGMLRLQIQAKNTSNQAVVLLYQNIAHLVLSSGKEIATVYASGNATVAAGATQTNNIDFVLPANAKVNQLRVRFGAANEAQLDIPLNGHADVSMYATKTVKLTKELLYLNMNWTLVSASSQLSFNGQQASKGMHYVTVTFNVSNPLMETVIPGSPYVYMHLKAGNNETTPVSADMPVSFDAGVSGKTGVATFQVPQDGSNLTLTLGAESSTGFDAATAIFQF